MLICIELSLDVYNYITNLLLMASSWGVIRTTGEMFLLGLSSTPER
jgi:hypothetical protein